MNLLDIIIIAMMVFLIVKGVLRGFIREIAALAGVILGIWLANHFQPQLTGYLKPHLHSIPHLYLQLISFAVIFISVLIIANLLGWGGKFLLKKAFLGWIDKTLGACLAIAKGVIISYLIIIILTFFLPAATPLIAGSKVARLITVSSQSFTKLIAPLYTMGLKRKIREKKSQVSGIINEKVKKIGKNE